MDKKARFFPAMGAALFLPAGIPAASQDLLAGRDLVDELRRGGYVIYFRHATTDFSRQDRVRAAGD